MRMLLTTLLLAGLTLGTAGCDDLEEVFEDLDLDIDIGAPYRGGYYVEEGYYEETITETEVIVEESWTPGGYVVEEIYYY